jgi:hypothetical protein
MDYSLTYYFPPNDYSNRYNLADLILEITKRLENEESFSVNVMREDFAKNVDSPWMETR